jgi:prepilin-type N-terminal cleavage/methylation domain-containing protein
MKRGFSLVELSIVLVILGLLTGGILAGQSLIRASELRSVSTELQKYQSAVLTFRDKYFALPGDMINAVQFWTAAAGNGTGNDNACKVVAKTGAPTCNGNGDGSIYYGGSLREAFLAWQHLANAGLIEGQYSSIAGPNDVNFEAVPGYNVPRSKAGSNVGWSFAHQCWVSGSCFNPTTLPIANNLFIGGYDIDGLGEAALTPEEAWNIDTKMDDGIPGGGNVIARRIRWCLTSNVQTDLTLPYDLRNIYDVVGNEGCSLVFRNLGF